MTYERCPCLEDPDMFATDSICRTCPWQLVAAVFAGREIYMSRADYTEHVVAALDGERAPEIIEAVRLNYGVDARLAKLAVRRATRKYKENQRATKR